MRSNNNWNMTRSSSAAVPEKILRAIRELKKNNRASGGNRNKTADDQKTSGDR